MIVLKSRQQILNKRQKYCNTVAEANRIYLFLTEDMQEYPLDKFIANIYYTLVVLYYIALNSDKIIYSHLDTNDI
jgi:hypothetical protein